MEEAKDFADSLLMLRAIKEKYGYNPPNEFLHFPHPKPVTKEGEGKKVGVLTVDVLALKEFVLNQLIDSIPNHGELEIIVLMLKKRYSYWHYKK